MRKLLLSGIVLVISVHNLLAQSPTPLVIAYFMGDSTAASLIPAEKLTHVIYSFGHLEGDSIKLSRKGAMEALKTLAAQRTRNPNLKIQVALGGWGGCATCSEVFSTEKGRWDFARSVKNLCHRTGIDGIDIDWEYPAIEGYPGHRYMATDRQNFTKLLRILRKELGPTAEISFAAGGFKSFVDASVDWKAVEPLVDRVNLMTYDLVTEGAPITGHHTGLYSSPMQERSSQSALDLLKGIGFPMNKVVLGCAFYARSFDQVPDKNNGLYQPGKFKAFIPYRQLIKQIAADPEIKAYRDPDAHAPYLYNASTHTYYTFDDITSVQEKTKYVIDHGLNGIMFWELTLDEPQGGLLDAIHHTIGGGQNDSSNQQNQIRKYWFVLLTAGPHRDQDKATAAKIQEGHLANIRRLYAEGLLKVAGPFGDDGAWQGIFIFDCPDKAQLEKILQTDPAISAGRLNYEIRSWYTSPVGSFKPGKPDR